MELQHINIKLFVDGELSLDTEAFIPIFHRWIQEKTMAELLIDVADYSHVPNGPGVMLIGHEADYSLDHNAGRYGMLYNRKAPVDGTNADRLRQSLAAAAKASEKLEAETDGKLKFSRTELELTINDRALAPNTAETLAECQPELESALADLLGHKDFTLQQTSDDPRGRFAVKVTSKKPFELAALA